MKLFKHFVIGAALTAAMVGMGRPASAAVDMYMEATDSNGNAITGGATLAGFSNFMEINDFSIAFTVTDQSVGGVEENGKPAVSPLVINAAMDGSMGSLLAAELNDSILKNVTLDLVRTGGTDGPQTFASWTLTNAKLTELDTSGSSGDETPAVTYTFGVFDKVEYSYTATNEDGTLGSTETVTFDLQTDQTTETGSATDFAMDTGDTALATGGVAVPNSVPEPASFALLSLGGLAMLRRRRA